MAALKRLLRRLWHWWIYTPPPPLGAMSDRWRLEHTYRARQQPPDA